MPAEPVSLLLRPRNFFSCNPVMDVLPAYSVTPSEVKARMEGFRAADEESKLVQRNGGEAGL